MTRYLVAASALVLLTVIARALYRTARGPRVSGQWLEDQRKAEMVEPWVGVSWRWPVPPQK